MTRAVVLSAAVLGCLVLVAPRAEARDARAQIAASLAKALKAGPDATERFAGAARQWSRAPRLRGVDARMRRALGRAADLAEALRRAETAPSAGQVRLLHLNLGFALGSRGRALAQGFTRALGRERLLAELRAKEADRLEAKARARAPRSSWLQRALDRVRARIASLAKGPKPKVAKVGKPGVKPTTVAAGAARGAAGALSGERAAAHSASAADRAEERRQRAYAERLAAQAKAAEARERAERQAEAARRWAAEVAERRALEAARAKAAEEARKAEEAREAEEARKAEAERKKREFLQLLARIDPAEIPVEWLANVEYDGTNLGGLREDFRPRVIRILQRLRLKGWQPYVASGRRTLAQQRKILAAGNSRTLRSYHLEGLAADIVDRRWKWGGPAADTNHPFWNDLGRAAAAEGLVWGGNFKSFKDVAHVQNHTR
jgi:hypothetical protein